jgi:hypothetical protein
VRIEAPWWRTEPIRTRLRFVWRRVDDLAFGLTVAAIVLVVALVWWRSLDGGGLPFLPTSGPPLAAFGPENPYAEVWPAGGAVPTQAGRVGERNAERDGSLTAGRDARRLEVVLGEDPTAPPFRSTPLGASGSGTSGSGSSGSGSSQDGWEVPGPGGGTLPGDGGGGGGGSSSPTPSSGPSPSPSPEPTTSPDPEPSQTPPPSPDPEPTTEPTSTASPCKSLPPNSQGDPCRGT